MPRRNRTVLITGFGPFPGMPHNMSAALVLRLAPRARLRFRGTRFVIDVLPVSWREAPRRVARLIARHRPDLSLHFGVSERAQGLVIETCARNIAGEACDCEARMASAAHIVCGGPAVLRATLPAREAHLRLARLGVPATLSDDAGTYLCNAVLYQSLAHGRRRSGHAWRHAPQRAGFIHIPAGLADDGAAESAGPLDFETALAGSIEVLRLSLADLDRRQGRKHVNGR